MSESTPVASYRSRRNHSFRPKSHRLGDGDFRSAAGVASWKGFAGSNLQRCSLARRVGEGAVAPAMCQRERSPL